MNFATPARARIASSPTCATFTAAPMRLLQRKCACGGSPGVDDECEECRQKRLFTRSNAMTCAEPTTTASRVAESRRGARVSSRGHNFGGLRVYPIVHRNADQDEQPTEALSGEEPDEEARVEDLPALGAGLPPTGGLEQGAQPLEAQTNTPKCPTKTVVDKTIDMTPSGIKLGYRTGYGAVAVIRVEPDSTDWAGTQIIESNKQSKNTCPSEFGISPCSGASTFTVGAGSQSSVLGALPATKNRFYDYHTSRWNKGSLLHDRNPKDIASCEVVCEQNYSCGGQVIGKHTVTRTFTKGTSGSRNVMLVAVTKS